VIRCVIDFQKPDPRPNLRSGDALLFSPPNQSRRGIHNIGKHRSFDDQYWRWDSERKAKRSGKITVDLIGEEEFDNRKTVVMELTKK